LGYLSVPFGKIHFNKTVSLDLGPQASFCAKRILLTMRNIQFAAVGGLGINLTKSIFLQGRYVLGLRSSKDA
jgi:hypothetical protein